MKLIDKDKIVAELKRLIAYAQTIGDNAINGSMQQFFDGMKEGYTDALSSIQSIETEDVDCEREIGIYTTEELLKKRNHSTGVFHLTQTDINSIAKHFFELGLKAKKGE